MVCKRCANGVQPVYDWCATGVRDYQEHHTVRCLTNSSTIRGHIPLPLRCRTFIITTIIIFALHLGEAEGWGLP